MENEGNWYGEGNYRNVGGILREMDPDVFLKNTKELIIDKESRENINYLKNHIKAGGKLDPLTLYEINTNDVHASDGRHRAIAAKELGIDKVPVVDYTSQLVEILEVVGKPNID